MATGTPVNTPFSNAQVHELLSATKYEQVSVLMGWFWRQVVEPSWRGDADLNVFCPLSNVLQQVSVLRRAPSIQHKRVRGVG
jgi:hypothetical protein